MAAGVTVIAGVLVAATPARAATTYTWDGEGDSASWGEEANWNPDGTPQDGDSIVVAQLPGGPSYVEDIPATTLDQITLGTGGYLYGGLLTATTMNWTGGIIYNDITVSTFLQVSGDDPKGLNTSFGGGDLTILGTATLGGTGTLSSNGEITNLGTITAIAPSSLDNPVVSGGVLDNTGILNAGPSATFTITNLTLDNRPQARLGGGNVVFGTTDIRLRNRSKLAGSVTFADRSVVTADDLVTISSGATIRQQDPSTTLSGSPHFAGAGTYVWDGGIIDGAVTLNPGPELRIDGTTTKQLANGATAPFTVAANATVRQLGTSSVTLLGAARIRNLGTWTVPAGAAATLNGQSCCTQPALFANEGTLAIHKTASLTVENMNMELRPSGAVQSLTGPGAQLHIVGGSNNLKGGAIDGTSILIDGNADLAVAGTTTLDADSRIRQTDRVDLMGTATFAGSGTYEWSDGTIYGQLTFGAGGTLEITDPDLPGSGKVLNHSFGPAHLTIKGHATVDSASPVIVQSTAANHVGLRNVGTLRWVRGDLSAGGAGQYLVNTGNLVVDPGAGNTVTASSLPVRTSGTVTLLSGTAAVTGKPLTQAAGLTRLAGGALTVTRPMQLDGGTLRGPGSITGSVVNSAGVVDLGPSGRGVLALTGSYTQKSAGTVVIKVANTTSSSGRDRLEAGGAVSLKGTLQLVRQGSTPLQDGVFPIVSGASRTGTFGTVTGLGGLGAGWAVTYSASAARLSR